MAALLFGYQGHLYISPVGHPVLVSSTDYITVAWEEMVKIGDEDLGADFEEVDTTTRDTARAGFASKVNTLKTGGISWTAQLRTLLNDTDGNLLRRLMYAAEFKQLIALLSLSEALDEPGAFGVTGNWFINYSITRTVKGLQELKFTANLQEFSKLVNVTNAEVLADFTNTFV